jgi:hypothetical protein
MGGQACVLYGAAEFSRDTDFAVLANARNQGRLRKALDELEAKVIAVPPFEVDYLKRGHAVHFRCQHPEAARLRIDIMSRMRGVDAFPKLWKRRTTITLPGGLLCELMSLPDLVQAKKTQRDKDWPMIRRLLEAHYFENRPSAKPAQIRFWLEEIRTAEILLELAQRHPVLCQRKAKLRPLLIHAVAGNQDRLQDALAEEERQERERDREYWSPLKQELEKLRRKQ